MDIYSSPMLNVSDAARYLGIPKSTLGSWRAGGAVHSVEPQHRGWPQLPFVAVVEAFVLNQLRSMGVPLRHIREAAHGIRSKLGDEYGLARPGLGVDGREVLVEVAGEYYRGSGLQQAAADTILGFQQVITWAGSDPQRLRLTNLGSDIILDPRFGWGAPVVEQGKVPVDALIDLYRAGESMEAIAYDFDLQPADVDQIVRGYLNSTIRGAA